MQELRAACLSAAQMLKQEQLLNANGCEGSTPGTGGNETDRECLRETRVQLTKRAARRESNSPKQEDGTKSARRDHARAKLAGSNASKDCKDSKETKRGPARYCKTGRSFSALSASPVRDQILLHGSALAPSAPSAVTSSTLSPSSVGILQQGLVGAETMAGRFAEGGSGEGAKERARVRNEMLRSLTQEQMARLLTFMHHVEQVVGCGLEGMQARVPAELQDHDMWKDPALRKSFTDSVMLTVSALSPMGASQVRDGEEGEGGEAHVRNPNASRQGSVRQPHAVVGRVEGGRLGVGGRGGAEEYVRAADDSLSSIAAAVSDASTVGLKGGGGGSGGSGDGGGGRGGGGGGCVPEAVQRQRAPTPTMTGADIALKYGGDGGTDGGAGVRMDSFDDAMAQ